jgi:hypothetical protein
MSASSQTVRVRYPLRAIAVVVLAGLFFLAELALLGLCMMPLFPLVPVFVTIMVGQACLLSSVVEYAASLARHEPVKTVRAVETTRPEGRAPSPAPVA